MADEFDIRSNASDKEYENRLRPLSFDDFNGQDDIVEKLKVYVEAARQRGDHLDHVLLSGPPGLGKTTLANIIANEMGVGFHVTSGPIIDKPGDLAGLLIKLQPNDVLFIDEIHRLSSVVEEYLYSAMEDFRIDIMLDKGANANSVQIGLNPFTLIGATTRAGKLTKPLYDRFGIKEHFECYDANVLKTIIVRSADILGVPIDDDAAYEISLRSRGTPRIANALLRRVRDFAQVKGNGTIDLDIARMSLKIMNIDQYGLDQMDIRILTTMIDKFNGRPVGLNTIATAVGEDSNTIEDVYEPYLVKEGFVNRTPRGRIPTEKSYRHLGYTWNYNNDSMQGTLF